MALVYSCCFWFSLRLGGILIGLFSIIKATVALIIFCVAYKQPQDIVYQLTKWKKNLNLIYMTGYFDIFIADPQKYLSYGITFCCIYIFLCVLYIYGAYMCNNSLMFAFILVELISLIILSIFVTSWLIVLKQNTMDIGLVIGASVASGFTLMGSFYLWVCAATLPVLINEIEREEQIATINKLQKLLENKNKRMNRDHAYSFFKDNNDDLYRRELFVIQRHKYVTENTSEPYFRSAFIH